MAGLHLYILFSYLAGVMQKDHSVKKKKKHLQPDFVY